MEEDFRTAERTESFMRTAGVKGVPELGLISCDFEKSGSLGISELRGLMGEIVGLQGRTFELGARVESFLRTALCESIEDGAGAVLQIREWEMERFCSVN
ncbi:hypothetical protein MA16_Dca001106 [Dendrobium catenatum]|uniref:Uncharacterized protein n=1 Tax=Dendrobium catenatum TaxID=906689 RepID=A0A2I0WLH0_9ASPA|nr:hypothetical protein MA16_Dca001106 [Dendrobium catenatum]